MNDNDEMHYRLLLTSLRRRATATASAVDSAVEKIRIISGGKNSAWLVLVTKSGAPRIYVFHGVNTIHPEVDENVIGGDRGISIQCIPGDPRLWELVKVEVSQLHSEVHFCSCGHLLPLIRPILCPGCNVHVKS